MAQRLVGEVPRCASQAWSDLILVIDDATRTTVCYERKEVLAQYSNSPLNLEVISNPSYSVYQQFILKTRVYLRPIKISLEDYLKGLLNEEKLAKDFKKKKLGEGSNGTAWQYGDIDLVEKEAESLSYIEVAINRYLRGTPCCTSEVYRFKIGTPSLMIMPKYAGSLEKKLPTFSRANIPKTLFEMVKGMYYAHTRGLMHLDLKFENIFETVQGGAVIGDWGNSKFFPYATMRRGEMQQTPSHRAPEVYLQEEWNWRADIYSLGLMGYEMWKKVPHLLQEESETYNLEIARYLEEKYLLGQWADVFHDILLIYDVKTKPVIDQFCAGAAFCPPLREVTNEPLRFLLSSMMCSDPFLRPTYAQILNDPFFDQVRGEEKFPEMSENEILNRLTPFQTKPKGETRIELLLYEWAVNVSIKLECSLIASFLVMALCNQYRAVVKVETKELQMCVAACMFLSGLMSGKFIPSSELTYYADGSFVQEQLEKYIQKVAGTLDFAFFQSFPYLFFVDQKLPEPLLRDLILYHVLDCSDDPRVVAAFLSRKYKLKSKAVVDVPIEYRFDPVVEDESRVNSMLKTMSRQNKTVQRRTTFKTGEEIAKRLRELKRE